MLARVLICLNRNTLSPNAVFGPIENLDDLAKFEAEHKQICKFVHVTRKLHHPKFGVFSEKPPRFLKK